MGFFSPNNVIYIIIQVIKSYGLFSMYNCCFLIILSPFFHYPSVFHNCLHISIKNPA